MTTTPPPRHNYAAMFIIAVGLLITVIFAVAYKMDNYAYPAVKTGEKAAILTGIALVIAGGLLLPGWLPAKFSTPLSTLLTNISLSIVTLLISLSLLEIIAPAKRLGAGIIVPPNQAIQYDAVEFSFTAYSNSLGFRGEDVPLHPLPGECRIAAVGDSFTYGWGVEYEDTWTHLLESELAAQGIDGVEVLNLGHPGWGPSEYISAVHRLGVLKPDMVLIATLQYDDLHQAQQSPQANENYFFLFTDLRYFITSRVNLDDTQPLAEGDSVRLVWQDIARDIVDNASPEQATRLDQLDSTILDLFFSGELNPAVVHLALTAPDYYTSLLDQAAIQPEVVVYGERMDGIRRALGKVPAVVVSVPYRTFSSHHLENLARLGFETDPALIDSTAADVAAETAATAANLPFYSVEDSFRAYSGDAPLYFELDGHFTEAGNRLFASALAREIAAEVSAHCSQ